MTLAYPKPHAHRDKAYLAYIRAQPCAKCGRPGPSHAAHMRCLKGGGTGLKPSDYHAIPLCDEHHNVWEHGKGVKSLNIDACGEVLKRVIDYFTGGDNA
jgi:hypothetical protein